LTAEGLPAGRHLMTIRQGAAQFNNAVRAMADAGRAAMQAARLGPDNIDWWIPHQANARIIREVGNILEIPHERTIDIVSHAGNSSAATIPIALAYAAGSGRLQRGQIVLLTAAGAGMLQAGVVLRW
jgi:3-oxoacyl-[acyl-carrier-protein] synthase-3